MLQDERDELILQKSKDIENANMILIIGGGRHTCAHTCAHTVTCTHMRTYSNMRACTHTVTCAHMRTYSNMHVHSQHTITHANIQ
jgi:hypothetical protein